MTERRKLPQFFDKMCEIEKGHEAEKCEFYAKCYNWCVEMFIFLVLYLKQNLKQVEPDRLNTVL